MKILLDLKDNRFKYVYELIKQKTNYIVDEINEQSLESLKEKDIVVYSPAHKWIKEEIENFKTGLIIVGGNICEEFEKTLKIHSIEYVNIMQDEKFVLSNATLTAEGFLCDLISNTSQTIFNQKILILGGGRVAKAVMYLLFKLGINFDISMRNDTQLLQESLIANNCLNWEDYKFSLKNYDVIVNTIPYKLFEIEDLKFFNNRCVVFELASKKCLDEIENKFKYILCPALPSKYSPQSAGLLVFEFLNRKILKGKI